MMLKRAGKLFFAVLIVAFLVVGAGYAFNSGALQCFEQYQQLTANCALTGADSAAVGHNAAAAHCVVPLALPPGTPGESEANPATTHQEFVAAIAAAADGDVIYLESMELESVVEIPKSVTLLGVNNAEISLSAEVEAESFHITAPDGVALTLKDLTLIGTGSAGGARVGEDSGDYSSTLIMDNCGIMNSRLFFIYGSGKLMNCDVTDNDSFNLMITSFTEMIIEIELTDCTFSNNSGCTTIIYGYQNITMENCVFSGNGWVSVILSTSATELTSVELIDCSFNDNGNCDMMISGYQNLTMNNCYFSDIYMTKINLYITTTAEFTDCTFSKVEDLGISGSYPNMIMTGCVFSENGSFSFPQVAEIKLTNCKFNNNEVLNMSGNNQILNITDCVFSGNDYFYFSSSIYYEFTMENCTFRENSGYIRIEYHGYSENPEYSGNIINCVFSGNASVSFYLRDAKFADSTFSNNERFELSGPLQNLIMKSCDFSGNDSFVFAPSVQVNLTMENCTFSENKALYGYIAIVAERMVSLKNCAFTNSGGVTIQTSGEMQLTSCAFEGQLGSQMYMTGRYVELTDFLISKNSIQDIYIAGTKVELVRCKIDENAGENNYPGVNITIISNEKGRVLDCTFHNNSAEQFTLMNLDIINSTFRDNSFTNGIAIAGQTVNMTDCTVSGNAMTPAYARSILNVECSFFNMTNCTVSQNKNNGSGSGGMYIASYTAKLINCTITGNRSDDGDGGGIYVGSNSILELYGSIIAGNTASGSGDNIFDDETGAWADVGLTTDGHYNIIGYANGVTEQSVFGGAPVVKDNGGATPTILINPKGPACNAIPASVAWDLPLTDQRGVARPQEDYADIGAVEIKIEPAPEPGEPPVPEPKPGGREPMATGDTNNLWLWIALPAGCGIGLWAWKNRLKQKKARQ